MKSHSSDDAMANFQQRMEALFEALSRDDIKETILAVSDVQQSLNTIAKSMKLPAFIYWMKAQSETYSKKPLPKDNTLQILDFSTAAIISRSKEDIASSQNQKLKSHLASLLFSKAVGFNETISQINALTRAKERRQKSIVITKNEPSMDLLLALSFLIVNTAKQEGHYNKYKNVQELEIATNKLQHFASQEKDNTDLAVQLCIKTVRHMLYFLCQEIMEDKPRFSAKIAFVNELLTALEYLVSTDPMIKMYVAETDRANKIISLCNIYLEGIFTLEKGADNIEHEKQKSNAENEDEPIDLSNITFPDAENSINSTQHVVSLLFLYAEFFSAPFVNQESYKNWILKQCPDQEIIEIFTQQLWTVLGTIRYSDAPLLDYAYALSGVQYDDINAMLEDRKTKTTSQCAIGGYITHLQRVIKLSVEENQLTNLCSLIEAYINDPRFIQCLQNWYQHPSNEIPRHREDLVNFSKLLIDARLGTINIKDPLTIAKTVEGFSYPQDLKASTENVRLSAIVMLLQSIKGGFNLAEIIDTIEDLTDTIQEIQNEIDEFELDTLKPWIKTLISMIRDLTIEALLEKDNLQEKVAWVHSMAIFIKENVMDKKTTEQPISEADITELLKQYDNQTITLQNLVDESKEKHAANFSPYPSMTSSGTLEMTAPLPDPAGRQVDALINRFRFFQRAQQQPVAEEKPVPHQIKAGGPG